MVAMGSSAGYRDELIFVGIRSVAQGYSECQQQLVIFQVFLKLMSDKDLNREVL